MRKVMTAVVVTAALAAVPMAGFAATAMQAKPAAAKPAAAKPAAAKPAPSHATTGTVKSMTADSLVVTRPGKKGGDMTFVLNSSTTKEGNPEVGSKVSVRYREEGKEKIATAVMVQGKPAAKN